MAQTKSIVIHSGEHYRAELFLPKLFTIPMGQQKKLYRIAAQDCRNKNALDDLEDALAGQAEVNKRLWEIASVNFQKCEKNRALNQTLLRKVKQAKSQYERFQKLLTYLTEQRQKYNA